MKRVFIIGLMFILSLGVLEAAKLKVSNEEVLTFKIANDRPTTVNFNFFVKKIKKIFNSKNKTQVRLLDKGIVIIPDSKKAAGVIIVTNEKGTSYTLNFSTDINGDSVVQVDDVSYSRQKVSKLNLETQSIDRDVSKAITLLDNMGTKDLALPGFELKQDSYTIYNKAKTFSMTRKYRYIGKKYIIDSWVVENLTDKPLFFENRDFASYGVIAASIQPKNVMGLEKASLYIFNNRSSFVNKAGE